MNDRIKKTFELIGANKKNILDIGCNEGILAKNMAEIGHRVVGIDISQRAINEAKKFESSNLKFICGNVLTYDFPQKFDIITLMETLEHLPNPTEYIKKIYDLLDDNGYFILSVPNAIGLCNILYNWKHTFDYKKLVEQKFDVETESSHINSFDRITLYRLLWMNGFELIEEKESFKFNPFIYQSLIMKLKKH